MKSQILFFLDAYPNQAWKSREVSRQFNITPENRKNMRQALKSLAESGKIMRLKGGRYQSLHAAKLIKGTLKMHHDGYGFVLPETMDQTDIFVPRPKMGGALPDDRVMVRITHEKADGRREGMIEEVLERGRKMWVGQLQEIGSQYVVVVSDYRDDIRIHVRQLMRARVGEIVAVGLAKDLKPSDELAGEIIRVLGVAHSEEVAYSKVMVEHGLAEGFPEEVVDQAQSIHVQLTEQDLKNRIDLRDKEFLTIDGLTARDFDDAVYAETKGDSIHLYVAIADVSHYVVKDSLLDREAAHRGTSTYFPDRVLPMLPEQLSNNLCSLKPGEDRLTLTCEMRFTAQGILREAWIYESVIHSKKRGIYEEVQNYFDGVRENGHGYEGALCQSLDTLHKLAELLMVHRKKRGSLDFDLPEALVVYDHAGKIRAIVRAKRFFSHRLVEECMIAANIAVACAARALNIPIPYRVHNDPDPVKLTDFMSLVRHLGFVCPQSLKEPKEVAEFLHTILDHPLETLLHQVLLRSMKVAVYTAEPNRHYGLNLLNYCHFTSPIRRYPDLIVHSQLKSCLEKFANKKIHVLIEQHRDGSYEPKKTGPAAKMAPVYNTLEIDRIAKQASERERNSMEAERKILAYKQAQFIQDHMGEVFVGVIRRVTKYGVGVELEPHFVEGFLHVRTLPGYFEFDEKRLRLVLKRGKKGVILNVGQRIRVKVMNVLLDSRSIELSFESFVQ